LEKLSEALIEYETLTGEEISALLKGEKIERAEKSAHPARASVPTVLPKTTKRIKKAPVGAP